MGPPTSLVLLALLLLSSSSPALGTWDSPDWDGVDHGDVLDLVKRDKKRFFLLGQQFDMRHASRPLRTSPSQQDNFADGVFRALPLPKSHKDLDAITGFEFWRKNRPKRRGPPPLLLGQLGGPMGLGPRPPLKAATPGGGGRLGVYVARGSMGDRAVGDSVVSGSSLGGGGVMAEEATTPPIVLSTPEKGRFWFRRPDFGKRFRIRMKKE